MESLALAVVIITSPAMYGGPIALLLTFWRPRAISKFRFVIITVLSLLSLLSGTFLLIENISRGAFLIGLLGFGCGASAIYRLMKFRSLSN